MKAPLYGLTLFVAIFFSNLSAGQEIIWQKTIGGDSIEGLWSGQITIDGSIIIGGYSNSSASGEKADSSRGLYDYWILKLNDTGDIVWQKTYGGNDDDFMHSITTTMDGGYACGGYSLSNISGEKSENSRGYRDFWVLKLDSVGDIIWQKTIGGTAWDELTHIRQTSDGGFILGGDSQSNVSGEKSEPSFGGFDYWIIKIDSVANIEWQRTIGGSSDDHLMELEITDDGGFLCGGSSNSGISGLKTEACRGMYDYWLVKLDSLGNIEWQKTVGGDLTDGLGAIAKTTDGGYLCGGQSQSGISGDKTEPNKGGFDIWFVKLNSTGGIEWQKNYGGSQAESSNSLQQMNDGSFISYGQSNSPVSGDKLEPVRGLGVNDCWILKLDQAGNLLWQKTIGGANFDQGWSCLVAPDSSLILLGSSASDRGFEKAEDRRGSWDYWVMKFSGKYNLIQGQAYIDFNSNNIKDSSEPGLSSTIIAELTTGRMAGVGNNGKYSLSVLDTGTYNVIPNNIPVYYTSTPSAHSASFAALHQVDSLNDFAFQPTGVFNDLCITITPTTPFRTNRTAHYLLSYINKGTTTMNATVVFYRDSNITFTSAVPSPSFVAPDSVVFSIGTLTPYQSGQILVTVTVNAGVATGTVINSGAAIFPFAGDVNPVCNINYMEIEVTGSYDPNDILVNRKTIFDYEINSPPFLEYTIRFQNTGNDTAFFVMIQNQIKESLQFNTFELITASHPCQMEFRNYDATINFIFNNILLPDSNVNEPQSHGFVKYRIRPQNNLIVGDSILNDAQITFDYNFPIQTSVAVTEIITPTNTIDVIDRAQVVVFPNPSSGSVNIKYQNKPIMPVAYVIYNLLGENVLSGIINNGIINLENLPNQAYILKLNLNQEHTIIRLVKMKN